MRCVSWNVNGLRAVLKKDFDAIFHELNADIFALQETLVPARRVCCMARAALTRAFMAAEDSSLSVLESASKSTGGTSI